MSASHVPGESEEDMGMVVGLRSQRNFYFGRLSPRAWAGWRGPAETQLSGRDRFVAVPSLDPAAPRRALHGAWGTREAVFLWAVSVGWLHSLDISLATLTAFLRGALSHPVDGDIEAHRGPRGRASPRSLLLTRESPAPCALPVPSARLSARRPQTHHLRWGQRRLGQDA